MTARATYSPGGSSAIGTPASATRRRSPPAWHLLEPRRDAVERARRLVLRDFHDDRRVLQLVGRFREELDVGVQLVAGEVRGDRGRQALPAAHAVVGNQQIRDVQLAEPVDARRERALDAAAPARLVDHRELDRVDARRDDGRAEILLRPALTVDRGCCGPFRDRSSRACPCRRTPGSPRRAVSSALRDRSMSAARMIFSFDESGSWNV